MKDKMDAEGLLSAAIGYYLDTRDVAAGNLLTHMVTVVRDCDEVTATEWLAEELQERYANRG